MFQGIFNEDALLKTKSLKTNHQKSVTKEVSKAIMLRKKLRNQFLKKKTLEARAKDKNRINLCVSLVEKPRRNYCKYLHLKDINDVKKFLDTVKALLCNKIKSVDKQTTFCDTN